MPLLSFDVYANYEEVIRLQREIATLQNKLKSFGPGTSITTIRSIESQLQSASARMRALTAEAARSGASLELNIRKGINGAIGAVNELQGKLSEPIMGLTQAAGIAGLGMFLNQVKNIRSEFQQMESTINTLVGETKGKTLMAQLTDFAKVSPLDFKGTVGGAQMMLGFGLDVDKVPRYLSAIGDVAMGDAQRFQSLTLAFSQMSAAGKLMGQDLNQMINAGFNPLQTMAETTKKSIATLKKEMSDGKITAAMVQQAFIDATSEGGKYYQMSEKASKTLGGQMSMLQDATDLMFNDLGKGAEGMIMKVIQGATLLVENWKTVGRIMIGAIATFGIYKASAMAADFAEKKSAEEKSQAIIDGYTKQLDAMAKYEAAKRAQQGLDADEDLVKPAAIDKLEKGETLNDKDLNELSTYTQRLQALQEEKERRDSVTKAMDEELSKLRELNGEKESADGIDDSELKLDEDLQKAVDLGADKEQVEVLQQQRDLLNEKAKIAGENLALADDEYNKALANLDAAKANVNALEKQKNVADALVDKLQEEYDLLSEDDLVNAPLDEYGQVTESIETLMKAEELEQAQKEASAKASELAAAQLALESAEEQVNSTETALNTAYTEADTAVQNRNNAAIISGTTAEVTNTAAIQANSAAEVTNTAATNANTASTTKNSIASKLAIGWSKMKTTAHHLETAAINGVKRATDALKLAWATNPLGIIFTVGTAIVSVLTSIFGAMEDIEEETNKFGNEAKKTANEVDLLFAVLETTNKQSKVYQESLEKLTGIAKDYGLVQKDEKAKLEDLLGLREKLIELIIEEGRQRQHANNIAKLQDSIKEDTENVEKKIKEYIIETNSGADRSEEWSEVASKLIAEDLERNAADVERLRQTIETYAHAKQDMFTEWTEQDQQTLDSAIKEYDRIVYGRANQVAKEYEGEGFALTIRASDMMGYANDRDLEWLGNYTDAVQKRNTQMNCYIGLLKQSQDLSEASQPAPEPYSALGKSFDDLNKDIQDAKDAISAADSSLAELNGKHATVNVDSSQAETAKTNVDAATNSVETHTATQGRTNIDSEDALTSTENTDEATSAVEHHSSTQGTTNIDATEADVARIKTEGATDEVVRLDSVSADPEIKTTWIDNFLNKLKVAWDALLEFLGVSAKAPTINVTPTPTKTKTASDIQKEREAAQKKRDAAISEMYNKAKSANTDKEFADAKRALTEYRKNLKRDSAEYKRVTEELKELEKRDARTSGKKSKGGSKDDPKQRAYEKSKAAAEEAKRLAELKAKAEQDARDLQIATMKDGSEKEIAEIHNEAKKKRDALLKERQAEADRLKQFDMKQWLKENKKNKEYQWKPSKKDEDYLNEAGQNIGYDNQYSEILFKEAEDVDKAYREELASMYEFLKSSGTFQQRRLALELEYDRKIKEARNDGERFSLEAEKQKSLDDIESQAIAAKIDWYSVFDNVGLVMKGQLEPLYQQLKDYTRSDAFKNSGADSQKTVIEAMQKLREQIGTSDSSWKDLAEAITNYQKALQELQKAQQEDKIVNERMRQLAVEEENARVIAETARNNVANGTGSQEDADAAQKNYEVAHQAVTDFGTRVAASANAVQTAQNKVTSSGSLLQQTAVDVTQPVSEITAFLQSSAIPQLGELFAAFDQLKGGIDGLKTLEALKNAPKEVSEGVQSAGDVLKDGMNAAADGASEAAESLGDAPKEVSEGVSAASEAVGDIGKGLEKAGFIAQIIAAIIKILEILKDGIGPLISGIIDTILNAISGIISNVLNFKEGMFRQIGESVYKGIMGIVKSIFTLGGWFDWFGNGESDKNLEKDIERLTNTNEALRKAVDNLAEKMQKVAVAEAVDIGNQQKENLEKARDNTQEMMRRSGAAYSNGFLGIGGSKSSNHKINEAMSKGEWARISEIVGYSVNSAKEFWNLSSEEMAKVFNDAPDLYAKIKQYANDGYKDAAQFMDEYIQYYKQIEEIGEATKERMTDISLDSVQNEFKSMLLDMESDTEDFADNFEKMMQQAVINSLMSSKYNEKIKQWYDNFAEAMKKEGGVATIDPAEQERLKREWDEIVAEATEERDQLKSAMGWDGSQTQQSSTRTLEGMSQDTGEAIEGRLTALQIAVESIRANEQSQSLSVAQLNNELLEVMQQYNRFNIHYDNIERQLAKIYVELQTISENTGAIVQPIKDMQVDIAQIKRNTQNL